MILVGGPSIENRNPSTAWPTIQIRRADPDSRFGCSERHNREGGVAVTVVDVSLAGSEAAEFVLAQDWQQCVDQGHDRDSAQGCAGVDLPPDPDQAGAGCLVLVRVPELQEGERTAILRFTLRAVCRSTADKPCARLTDTPDAPQPSADEPVTVEWVHDEEITARVLTPEQGG